MKLIEQNNLRILIADQGKILKQDNIYSNIIYLGISASPDEWNEISIEEVPENERLFVENNLPIIG